MDDFKRFLGYAADQNGRIAAAIASGLVAALFLTVAIGMTKDLFQVLGMTAQEQTERARAGEAGTDEPSIPESGERRGPAEDQVGTEASEIGLTPLDELEWKLTEFVAPFRDWLHEDGYIRVPLFLIGAYLLRGIFGFFAAYGIRRVGLLTIMKIRQEVYEKAISQSDDYYRTRSTGDTMARITSDLGRLGGLFKSEFAQAIQSVPVIVFTVGFALYQAPQVSVACFAMIPMFAFVIAKFGKRIKSAAKKSQERVARRTEIIEETLLARRIVQVFGATKYESGRFREVQQKIVRQELKVARTMAASSPVVEVMSTMFGAGLIIYSGRLIERGDLDPTSVVTACVALVVAFTNVRRVSKLNNAIQNSLAAARRVFEMLDANVAIADSSTARPCPEFQRALKLEGVSYTYGRGPVLQGIDLEIRAGETHALVGSSGAGKTTLALLIPRFLDPTEGRVTIDGIDLRSVTVESLRSQIAYVSQETHLFDDTVLANIGYGRPDASEDEIRRAARAANAEPFILDLPKRYGTKLGDRGGRLSVGQRQRVAIARAFLKDAPILLLDEATSSLDSESERQVHIALEALLEGRTTLIIAHRLTTVTRADAIHVLDRGRVIESGTHEELRARGGAYERLFALQQG